VLWTFVPIAALLSVAPGPGTAMVVRSSLRDGWRAGVLTVAGNEIGVVVWALLSVLGVSALVAASEAAFVALKIAGAAALVWLGVQSLRGSPPAERAEARGGAFRAGLITSIANPKLAVFFVALFPQFVEPGSSVLPTTLLMATLIVIFDFLWYTALAVAVSRAKTGLMRSRVGRWLERVTGAVMIALGARVALEQR
jgi:RhtB (resistance to homoserine/threonine) family protein